MLLSLSVPPSFLQQAPSVLTAVAGDDVILPCDVLGEPEPVISWRKNHANIDLFSMNHKYLMEDTGSLVIPAAGADDSARYLCVAENPAGVLAQEISLIIYGRPHSLMVVRFSADII